MNLSIQIADKHNYFFLRKYNWHDPQRERIRSFIGITGRRTIISGKHKVHLEIVETKEKNYRNSISEFPNDNAYYQNLITNVLNQMLEK